MGEGVLINAGHYLELLLNLVAVVLRFLHSTMQVGLHNCWGTLYL